MSPLIEPYGIEMYSSLFRNLIHIDPLIEPYGIEIVSMRL